MSNSKRLMEIRSKYGIDTLEAQRLLGATAVSFVMSWSGGNTYNFRTQLYDSDTKNPIPNVLIQYQFRRTPAGQPLPIDWTDDGSNYTDSAGMWLMTGITFSAELNGYLTQWRAYIPSLELYSTTWEFVVGQDVHELFTLSINSTPVPVTLTKNGSSYTTPWSDAIPSGSYTIKVPSTVVVGGKTYSFQKWDDGPTDPVRTINLTSNTELTAIYTTPAKNYLPYTLAVTVLAVVSIGGYTYSKRR